MMPVILFLHLEHIWSISHLRQMQPLARRNNCCYVTKYHSCNLGYNYICAVGYCLYRALQLHARSACPVQIWAHHHIDVFQTSITSLYLILIMIQSICNWKSISILPVTRVNVELKGWGHCKKTALKSRGFRIFRVNVQWSRQEVTKWWL